MGLTHREIMVRVAYERERGQKGINRIRVARARARTLGLQMKKHDETHSAMQCSHLIQDPTRRGHRRGCHILRIWRSGGGGGGYVRMGE